jgi:hypothetical protein
LELETSLSSTDLPISFANCHRIVSKASSSNWSIDI